MFLVQSNHEGVVVTERETSASLNYQCLMPSDRLSYGVKQGAARCRGKPDNRALSTPTPSFFPDVVDGQATAATSSAISQPAERMTLKLLVWRIEVFESGPRLPAKQPVQDPSRRGGARMREFQVLQSGS